MKKQLFWRLFVILALGVATFFSLLHSAALLSEEKMSYIKAAHQQQILAWAEQTRVMLKQGQKEQLALWLAELSRQENTWVTVVRSQVGVVVGDELNERFWSGHRIGRSVEWKIHLDFDVNPIMEVELKPSDYRFLIILPDRMRPGAYQPYAFWFYRAVIPFFALFALTLYIYRHVMTPLMRLHKASIEFSRGNYQARVLIDRDDEFGQVATTFNLMAQRTASLIEHNSNLIADMSHEIRTPIARVEMALDCAEHGVNTELLQERIRADIKLMRQLCEDTLTLAWIENEQPDLRTESFDLVALIDILLEDAQFEFPDRNIHLESPPTIPLRQSNQRSLGYALENIIRNGLRFTPQGKALKINVWQTEKHALIDIVDSGPGLDSALFEKIFIPFFKANNQTQARKGFGVGLALAKRHVQAIRGDIRVYNHVNSGLVFQVTLPLFPLD